MKQAHPKADQLRAMREANFDRGQRKPPASAKSLRAVVSNIKPKARKTKQGKRKPQSTSPSSTGRAQPSEG